MMEARPFPPSPVSYSHSRTTSSRRRYLRYSWFFSWLAMLARCTGLMAMRTSVATRSSLGEAAGLLDLDLARASGLDLEMRGPVVDVDPPVLKCDNVDCRSGAAAPFFPGGNGAIVC